MNTESTKKRNIRLILLIFVLMLAAVGCGGWYVYQRQLPQKTVEEFLGSMQKTDFQNMENLLQSSDLSALENADIRDDAYLEFFKSLNKKMSWSIVDSHFDYQNGTARITAHVRYIDGSEIYREAITEFLRRMVSDTLAGSAPDEAQIKASLAEILTEKAASAEDRFTETDITYPLIKTGKEWKIVSLDEETIRIMSANFRNIKEELEHTLHPEENPEETTEDTANDVASESAEPSEAAEAPETDEVPGNDENMENEKSEAPSEDDGEVPADASADTASEDAEEDTLLLDAGSFTIRCTDWQVNEDFSGNPCLLVYYDYTNNADSASSAMVDVRLQAFQNEKSCGAAIPAKSSKAIDRFMEEIQPGETVSVCQAFSLSGKDAVTLRAGDASGLSGELKSLTLELE